MRTFFYLFHRRECLCCCFFSVGTGVYACLCVRARESEVCSRQINGIMVRDALFAHLAPFSKRRSTLRSLEPVFAKKREGISVRPREIACFKVYWERGGAILV